MNVRRVLAILVVLLAAGAVAWYVGHRYAEDKVVPALKMTETLKDALKMKQEQSRSGFQLAVVLLGALWSTLLAKKDDITFDLRDWPPTVMFVVANGLLLASVYFHLSYLEFTSNELWARGVPKMVDGKEVFYFPDILHTYLNNPYFGQNMMLGAGLLGTVLHLLVVYKFKPAGPAGPRWSIVVI